MIIRLLVSDRSPLLGQAIACWLMQHEDMELIGSTGDDEAAVALACQRRPHVMLVTAYTHRLKWVEMTRDLAERAPAVRVLILADELDGGAIRHALKAGARGYLSRQCEPEELVTAVRCLCDRGTYLSQNAGASLVDNFAGTDGGSGESASQLTARERQVLQLFAEGLHTKAIASELSLSPKTVDWHKSRLTRKLGIESVAGLVRYAIAEGLSPLIPPGPCREPRGKDRAEETVDRERWTGRVVLHGNE